MEADHVHITDERPRRSDIGCYAPNYDDGFDLGGGLTYTYCYPGEPCAMPGYPAFVPKAKK